MLINAFRQNSSLIVNLFARHGGSKSARIYSGLINPTRNLNYTPISTEKKIQIGHKMTQVIDKNRQASLIKQIEKQKYLPRRSSQHLLLSSCSASFNHYQGQVYRNFTDKNLASVSWQSRNSCGKFFTINPSGAHPSLLNEKQYPDKPTFLNFNLNRQLVDSLNENFNIQTPTQIQYKALNEILERNSHLLVVAETGGGKTFTYLLPMVETCLRTKTVLVESGLKQDVNQPLGLVIVPTRELVFQVYDTLKQLLASVDSTSLSVACDLNEGLLTIKKRTSSIQSLNDCLEHKTPVDILVTTPAQLQKRLQADKNVLNSVYLKQVVLDEADTLLDDSFNETTLSALGSLELNLNLDPALKTPSTQLVFVSATVPRDMKHILESLIDCDTEL